jgi:hypothetical protein
MAALNKLENGNFKFAICNLQFEIKLHPFGISVKRHGLPSNIDYLAD